MLVVDLIEKQIKENPIVLYMKGTPMEPSCRFSAKVVRILAACDVEFAYVNVLAYPEIRQELPAYSNWPTFPQLWVNGKLIGGCDVVRELYKTDQLQPLLAKALEQDPSLPI